MAVTIGMLCLLMAVTSCTENDSEFKELDDALNKIDVITAQKEQNIGVIRRMLGNAADDNERYAINNKLYDEYMSFKYDSAVYYVERNIAISQKMGDEHRMALSKMKKVYVMAVNGLFSEATVLLNTVDTTLLSRNEMTEYFDLHASLEVYYTEYYADTEYMKSYIDRTVAYRNKIIEIADKRSYIYKVAMMTNMAESGKTKEAITMLEDYLKVSGTKSGERRYSILTSIMAFFYEKMGDHKQQRKYLILSALSDINGSVRENKSLRDLAFQLFTTNDFSRAYKYLKFSLDDANFYGTRLRNIQAAKLTPMIVNAYMDQQDKSSRAGRWGVVALSVLTALLICGMAFTTVLLRRYHRANRMANTANEKLNDAFGELQVTHDRLTVINDELKETGRVKDEYLGRFLDLNAKMLDKVDASRKRSLRMVRDHKLDELVSKLKNDTFVSDMSKEFNQNFDEAFLNIYPDFVSRVNALLLPEERLEQKDTSRLSTELRIMALIRLGISDNQRIAIILRTSLATVYTYRSRMKAKAIDKEHFEENVCRGRKTHSVAAFAE